MFMVVALLPLLTVQLQGLFSGERGLFVPILLPLFGILWAQRLRLQLTPSQLIYRSLWRGTITIARKDIKSADIEVDFGGGTKPRPRLKRGISMVIRFRNRRRPLYVNAGIMPRRQVNAILDELQR